LIESFVSVRDLHLSALALAIALALAGAVLSRLLFNFYRDYDRNYLLHWAWSWTSLSISQLAIAGLLIVGADLPGSHPVRILLGVIAGVAAYFQMGWLCIGAWELARRRTVSGSSLRWISSGLVLAGVVTSLLFVNDADVVSSWPATLQTIATCAAFFYAAAEVWQARTRNLSFGLKLVSASFGVYALNKLSVLLTPYFAPVLNQIAAYQRFLGFIDFVLLALMGIGMVALLLDDEREVAVQATVEIEHLAYHDALTSLPNRLLFMDRLEVALAQAHRYEQKLAVLVIDLDRFKEINDSLGHSTGDLLLKQVTERLRKCVRQADTVARLGGDEFGVIIQKIEGFEDAAKVAQKVIDAVKMPYMLNGRELAVSASIGIGLFPDDGLDAESLVKNSDTAMYRAKDQNRDTYRFYESGMNARALERLALENRLRRALAGQELVIFYQPLVDLRTRRVTGFEALLRWNHPELGLLMPVSFIHAAEVSGLIVPIGAWVLRTACDQAKNWQRRAPGVGLSVNLSARQFQEKNLVETVQNALDESELDPHLLELEITETNAMHDAEHSIRTLEELKKLGVRISMDDFGTGYSSLSYLKKFPIDILKLDQSFVRDITSDASDGAIATAVIAMAHSLSLKVVAEGVETRGQLTFLRERSCDRIQGYFFSPPLNPVDFENFIDERSHAVWHELRELAELRAEFSH
jgi:diguanylate cyclase (GGDEF)-like protein